MAGAVEVNHGTDVAVREGEDKGELVPMMSKEDLAIYNSAIEDNVSQESIRYARLAIVQPGTPEVQEGVPGYKAGMLMTNTEKMVLSHFLPQPWLLHTGAKVEDLKTVHCLEILPVFKLPDEYIEWIAKSERKEGEGLWRLKTLERTVEVLQGLPHWRGGKWRKSDTQPSPPITENCNLLIAPLSLDGNFNGAPIVGGFSRTSFKAGEKLMNACRQHRHVSLPWHGRTYWLYTEFKENAKGKFFVLRMARGRALNELPDWKEKHQLLIAICRMLANPAPSEVVDKTSGKLKTLGRVEQERLISAAVLADESGDETDADGEVDDFAKDHFEDGKTGGSEPAF